MGPVLLCADSFYCFSAVFIVVALFLLWLGRCFSCYLRVASYFYNRLLCCAVFDRYGSRLESEAARCRCSMRFLPCGACCYHYKVRSFCCLTAWLLLLLRFRNAFCFFSCCFLFYCSCRAVLLFSISKSKLLRNLIIFECCTFSVLFFSSCFCFLVLFAVFLLFVCPDLFVVIVSVTLNI